MLEEIQILEEIATESAVRAHAQIFRSEDAAPALDMLRAARAYAEKYCDRLFHRGVFEWVGAATCELVLPRAHAGAKNFLAYDAQGAPVSVAPSIAGVSSTTPFVRLTYEAGRGAQRVAVIYPQVRLAVLSLFTFYYDRRGAVPGPADIPVNILAALNTARDYTSTAGFV